ncbi:MAG: cobalamin-binding protein [Planctomycetaceae bacterium]|nr:cobalamin-binding protein [Planctomycetales bacterium]MCB9924813.1 cobalamin-binding protein [Planctomycetaceae bacterium]
MIEHRIVSLLPSATEIVAALGYEHTLVGRSHECDFPASVKSLPVCSEPRIDVSGMSDQIDKAVAGAIREALSVYRVFSDELNRLQPTIIITQTQCDVCAVSLRDIEAAVCEFAETKPVIVALQPMALCDILSDMRQVANAIGDEAAGERLVGKLQRRFADLAATRPTKSPFPTVACIEWLDPLMVAGNWIPELVELAGGQPVLCESGKHSPWIKWGDLLKSDPDYVVIMPCGFDIHRTVSELHLLTEHPSWQRLNAVRNNRVFLADGNQYFNRSGPRVIESAEILTEILHGYPSRSNYCGFGWRPLNSD